MYRGSLAIGKRKKELKSFNLCSDFGANLKFVVGSKKEIQ